MAMVMAPVRKILKSRPFPHRIKLSLLRTVVRQTLPQHRKIGRLRTPCPMTPMRIPPTSLKPSLLSSVNTNCRPILMPIIMSINLCWIPCLLQMVITHRITGMPLLFLFSPPRLKAPSLPSRACRLHRIFPLGLLCKTSPLRIQTIVPMMTSGLTIHIARNSPIHSTVGLGSSNHSMSKPPLRTTHIPHPPPGPIKLQAHPATDNESLLTCG